MSTQYVYPTGDVTTEWTPSTGTVHYSLLNEDPANTSNYISVAGFTGGDVDRIKMDNGVASTINTVSQYVVSLDIKAAGIANSPALRARFYVGLELCGFTEFTCDTGGVWDVVNWTIPLPNIPSATWYAASIELELIPINGDIGYSPST